MTTCKSKQLDGVSNRSPFKVLNVQSQNSNSMLELVLQDRNKFWSVRSIYILTLFQIIFGIFLCFTQFAINEMSNDCEECVDVQDVDSYDMVVLLDEIEEKVCSCTSAKTYAMWFGGVVILSGLLSALAVECRPNFLLVTSSIFFCIVGCLVSFCCLVESVFNAQDSDFDIERGAYTSIALVSGLNLFVSILTAALLCRASCSCCQPHAPTFNLLMPQNRMAQKTEPIFSS